MDTPLFPVDPKNFFKKYAKIMRPVGRATGWWMRHVPRRARSIDEARRAKRVLTPWNPKNIEKWRRHHNRYDLIGVDDPVTNPRRLIRLMYFQAELAEYIKFKKYYKRGWREGNIAFKKAMKRVELLFRGVGYSINAVLNQIKRGYTSSGGQYSKEVVSTSISPLVSSGAFGPNMLIIDKRELEKLGAEFFPLEYLPEEELERRGITDTESGKVNKLKWMPELEVRIKKHIPADAIGALVTDNEKILDKIKDENYKMVPLPLHLIEGIYKRLFG